MHRFDDPDSRFDISLIDEKAETCKQWGKWGADDEFGTLNHAVGSPINPMAIK